MANVAGPKKRTFDMKAIIAKKNAETQDEEKKIPDPKGIRLTELPNGITEEELLEAIVEKFGQVERCFMPMEMGRTSMRNRGFAIINFKRVEDAARAVLDGEITVNFAGVAIT